MLEQWILHHSDDNGNLTDVVASGETFATYAYAAADRLISYNSGCTNNVHTCSYNDSSDRYRQTVDGVSTDYLLDLNSGLTQVLGEFGPNSDTYYLLGLDVIGQQQGTNWSYFGYDGLGSVRQMTDAGGAVTYSANYDPYGSSLEQFGVGSTNLGFTGEYTDPSGMLYLRARYANLSTATFLTRDPVAGVMGMSASYNGYGYVQGNPVNLTDPSGKFPFLAVIAGGLIGGGIDLAMQLLVEGKDLQCVDWGSVAFSALTGAVGGGIGSMTNKMGLIARLAIDALADTAVSTAIDVAFRGGEFGDSFRRNMIAGVGGSLLGEAGGRLLGAGLKRASKWLRGAGDSVQLHNRDSRKIIIELFSGPQSQIDRSVAGYMSDEARIFTIDIDPRVVQSGGEIGDATNLRFDDGFADEVFITNPFNENLRPLPPEYKPRYEEMDQFKMAFYEEAARVLKPEGELILSFAGNNRYAKVLGLNDQLRPEIAQLGFSVMPPYNPVSPRSPYSVLHEALQNASFGRPDGSGAAIPASAMRTIILRKGG